MPIPEDEEMAAAFDDNVKQPNRQVTTPNTNPGDKVHAPIDVHAEIVPPSHIIREHPLSQTILWHRRFGHRKSKKVRMTAKHVIGLGRHKDPSFCECCAQSNMRAKARTNQHKARRPQADEVLGQVSLDLVDRVLNIGQRYYSRLAQLPIRSNLH
jgi:hypothetical protein